MHIPQSQKIVLITSGQPSLNPRLVKEADTLAGAGYDVTVLYAYWNDWGTKSDVQLLAQKKWKAIRVGGDPNQKPLTYFISRLVHRLSVFISKFKSGYFSDLAIARGSFFLTLEARKHKADLYIGHNLGALPATIKAAKYYQKLCGFDAEDFHRYEVSDDDNDAGVILKTYIENKYIPQVNYLSASSQGIGAAYHQLYKDKLPVTLLNVFPANPNIAAPALIHTGTIKLFWFSQTIGDGRGVSDCIKALLLINSPLIELHLLGAVTDEVKQKIIYSTGDIINVYFYQPVQPDEIIPLASKFDIGLALEDSVPLNRDICLTNKIFTYMQAGLAIIASGTTAQKQLLATYADIGKIYENDNFQMLAAAIQSYFADKEALYLAKMASCKAAHEVLNWEKESKKFLNLIKNTLAV